MTAADMRKMCEDVLRFENAVGLSVAGAHTLATELLKRLDAEGTPFTSRDVVRWRGMKVADVLAELSSARQPVVDRQTLVDFLAAWNMKYLGRAIDHVPEAAEWLADHLLSSGLIRAVPNPTSEKDS